MLHRPHRSTDSRSNWQGVADLMAGLMMIFLFIAVSYMESMKVQADHARTIAVAYKELQDDLYEDLYDEFQDDLAGWMATIDRQTLSVRFQEPSVLFTQGSATVTPRFQAILADFFPRYLRILRSPDYRDSIEEIRIEGHTSSEWEADADASTVYFENMRLSQSRTTSVLRVCLGLLADQNDHAWARRFLTANGLSSSRLIQGEGGNEDRLASGRVEFRTRTAAENKVVEIIREIEK